MMRRSQSTERQNKRNWGFKLWIAAQKNRKSSFERNNEKISVRIRRHDFHLHSTYTRRKCLIMNGAGEGNRTLVSGLGSPRSTIEPHPLRVTGTCSRVCLVAQLFDASNGCRYSRKPTLNTYPRPRVLSVARWFTGTKRLRPCSITLLERALAPLKTAPFSRAAAPAARWPHASPGSCASDRNPGNKRKPPHCHKSCPA